MLASAHSELACSSTIKHLLAASTLHHILLLDMQRPVEPLLLWQHGASAAKPPLAAPELFAMRSPPLPQARPSLMASSSP